MSSSRTRTGQHRYGSHHKKVRRRYALQVKAGKATCWRCGLPIAPDEPWDLGHDDDNPSSHRGPEHRACNRATLPRMLAKARGERSDTPRFGGLPDPTPGNSVEHWSRHWAGPFNPRCPDCRARGSACDAADEAVA
jgi:hypothetical protein